MFPSQGVCMEGPMQPDVEAILDIFRAFNRWIDDEWGFAYHDRIFAAPYLTLSDLDAAIAELEWVLGPRRADRRGAPRPGVHRRMAGGRRPIRRSIRSGHASPKHGSIVACHPGFDDGYRDVENAVARSWGYESRRRQGSVSSLNFYEPVVAALMGHRLIHDFMGASSPTACSTGIPGSGSRASRTAWAGCPTRSRPLRRLSGRRARCLGDALVDQFHEHVWVTPFTDDDVPALLEHVPVERVLFGSDYPHAEGFAEPKQFVSLLDGDLRPTTSAGSCATTHAS